MNVAKQIGLPEAWEEGRAACILDVQNFIPQVTSFEEVSALYQLNLVKCINHMMRQKMYFSLDFRVLGFDTAGEELWANRSITFRCESYDEAEAICRQHGLK